ncbi:hypothetical protein CEP53_009932 [Fusarium sp. AF-6]|nr:hypothetical protein CEP53_009932 [Fusarium sp. AF-6]
MADIPHRNQSHQPYTLPGGSNTHNELEPKPDIETSSATSFVSATDQQPDIPTIMMSFENWTLPKRFWNNSLNDLEVITFQWIDIADSFLGIWLSLGALATVPFHYYLGEYIKGKLE